MLPLSNSKIFSLTLGTSPTQFRANQKRVRGVIQNLSGNTVYISKSGNADTNQAIELQNDQIYKFYDTDERYLWASAASTLIRIEEKCLQ